VNKLLHLFALSSSHAPFLCAAGTVLQENNQRRQHLPFNRAYDWKDCAVMRFVAVMGSRET
jgi:hypothetical protein